MNKPYLIELAKFNLWATNIVCSWLERLNDIQWETQIVSSFNSIERTALHTVAAQNAWVERLLQKEKVTNLYQEFKGTKTALLDLWRQSCASFEQLVTGFDEAKLSDAFSFRRFNGEESSLAHYQVFMHVINHGTYHRGQLVTMLRQIGFTDLQTTDISSYYRYIGQL